MIFNPGKCYFVTPWFQDCQRNFSHDSITIKNMSEEKILGITIDNNQLSKVIWKISAKNTNQKLNALVRITKFTSPSQRKPLLNSFIKSQLSYCPLIWIFPSKGLNKKISRIHKKSLRLVWNNHQSTLDEMLVTLKAHSFKFFKSFCLDIFDHV